MGSLLPVDGQLVVWIVAAGLVLSTPTLFRRRLSGLRYDAIHLAERFGAFVLIALGESVVTIGSSAQERGRLGASTGLAVTLAFALCCGLWWVYFQFAADAVRHSLATARVQLDITRSVLSYGHLSFIASIIAVAVGLRAAVAAPTQQLGFSAAGLPFGGSALFPATFSSSRWSMFRLMFGTRPAAAAVALVLLSAATVLPSAAGIALLATVLAVLNSVKYARVEHTGFQARLTARPQGDQ